jgi:hypothetical protein
MAYTDINFKTKKALKDALKSGEEVTVYQPGPFGSNVPDGNAVIEGPHYPQSHTWYAAVIVKNGVIVKIKS